MTASSVDGGNLMPPGGPPDEELLFSFVKGQSSAFDELLRRYEQRIYRFLRRLVSSRQEAEDLFQETFARVCEHAASFTGRGPFRRWLYTIALNVWRARGRKTRPTEVPIDETTAPASDCPDPAEAAHRTEVSEYIAEATASLPPSQREVFIMKVYEQITFREIAEILGRPIPTVKSQMMLAVQKLRPLLERLADVDEMHGRARHGR